VRFAATVECTQALRVGDREGRMLPAHLVSGGRAVLASRSDEEIAAFHAAAAPDLPDLPTLLRELRRVRRRGFALNDQATETGLTAIGRAVRGPGGAAVAAVSLAMPTARFRRDRLAEWTQHVATTVSRIEGELAAT
jgi:IclR family acetate operon transcriptional repressor